MQQYNTQRVVYLDLIRIVATFGVIFLHVFCKDYYSVVGTYNWFIAVIGDSIVRWSVPLFVMISGALFLQPNKDVTYRVIMKKYIPRLLLAYFFWWLAYSTIMTAKYIIIGKKISLDLLAPHFHLWYIPMLIGVYLLIPILRKIASDDKLTKTTLVLWLLYLIGCFLQFVKIPQIGVLFNANPIIGYAGYFLLGYYVSKKDITNQQAHWIYFIGVIGAFIGICGNILTSYLKGTSSGFFLNNLGPHVVTMSLALFVLIKKISPKIENKLLTFIEYVRKDLFGIYLTHALWLLVLDTNLFRNLCNQIITLPLITIGGFYKLTFHPSEPVKQVKSAVNYS